VSLAKKTGGPALWASAKLRARGYLVLLNKCSTMHINPANTNIPVLTPSNVGKSDAIADKSTNKRHTLEIGDDN
jgi:hypothetical protein